MTAAKVMDIISRLPGCAGQAADAVSVFSQVKMEDAPELLKLESHNVPIFGYVHRSTNGHHHVQYGRPSRFFWAESVWSSFGRTVIGKAIWENPIEVRLGEGFQLGMLIRTPCKRVVLFCVCGWHKTGWIETKPWSDVETTQRSRFGRTNIFPWSWKPGMYSKTMWNKQGYCGQLQKYLRIQGFCWSQRKNYRSELQGNLMQKQYLLGLITWNVMQRSAWKDIANWQTKQRNNYSKSHHHALTTTNSKRKKWDLSENCLKFAHKLSWHVCIWLVL